MNISVIGTGYVGLVTGTCFSEMGNNVWCIDVDVEKIDRLNNGSVPIYEPGLSEMVVRNHNDGRLNFTTDYSDAVPRSDICFIAVGTPPGDDGSADMKYVLAAAKFRLSFLYASTGYGGFCFPKDVKEIISLGKRNGIEMKISEAVENVNEEQKFVLPKKIMSKSNCKTLR